MTSKISSYILCIESKHKNKRVRTLPGSSTKNIPKELKEIKLGHYPKCPGSEGLLFKIARKSTAEEPSQAKNIVVIGGGK